MSSFFYKMVIVWSFVYVTFGRRNLEEIISSAVDQILEGVDSRLAQHTELLESRLAAHARAVNESMTDLEERRASEAQSLGRKIRRHTKYIAEGMEKRLTTSCSASSRDIGRLVSTVFNASSQVAGCCVEPPTERPTATPTERPTTTPSVRPTTTPTPTEAPRGVIFLRRQDGSVDFYRNWEAYQFGFGNQTGEFWLGLDNLHNLTTRHKYSLRADIEDWSGETKWEEWSTFRVTGEGAGYELTVSGHNPESTAGRNLNYNNGWKFSTHDRDNDGRSYNCAVDSQGAWWYGYDTNANPTGPYKPAGYTGNKWIYWINAYRDKRSFKAVTMRLVKV